MATEVSACSGRARQIGVAGTVARVLVGVALVGSVVAGHLRAFYPLPWLVGLVLLPGLTLGWQTLRTQLTPGRLQATSPVAHLANVAVFFALYLTPYYAPRLSFTSDAALLFYGTSMLLAAARGYPGCEVLAISNWLLRRNDQIGCLLFLPIDTIETRRHHNGAAPGATSREGIHHA
jgi:hypothetical protein